ncbi:MAG: hypothetical protein KY447_12735 [Actinobacteria bacterium]|nr:hypothetical protein [Actinomycetota bacterium]
MAEEGSVREEALIESLARQVAVVEDLVARAGDAMGWLAVHGQVHSYLRRLQELPRGRASDTVRRAIERHEATLERHRRRSRAQLAAFDPATLADARARVGLRVAVIGKGGAGKTVISSTLARILARRGRSVLAADLDANPGLATSLGIGPFEGGLPLEALEENEGSAYGWRLARDVSPREVVERFATPGPDGVRLVAMGKIGGLDKSAPKKSAVALGQVLLGFREPGWDVVADLEAGPTTPFEGYHAFADDVVVAVGPAWRSAMTARRLLPMVGRRNPVVVANRFSDEPDHPGLAPRIRIPFDPEVAEAERQGLSPLDACPDSPAVRAIARLADHLVNASQEVPLS